MISLLNPNNATETGNVTDLTVADLALDRSFIPVLPDNNQRREFLKMLAKPSLNRETVIYRQAIMRDLLKNPTLLEELMLQLSRAEQLAADYEKSRKMLLSLRKTKTDKLDYTDAQTLLGMSATVLKRMLRFVSEFDGIFEHRIIKSEGLSALKSRIKQLADSPENAELTKLCEALEANNDCGEIRELCLSLNEKGRVSAEIQSITFPEPPTVPTKKRFGSKEKKHIPEPFEEPEGVELFGLIPRLREGLFSEAAGGAATMLGQIVDGIAGEFSTMKKELTLYLGGYRLVELLRRHGVEPIFPEITDRSELICHNLYDLFLLIKSETRDTVVPNDVGLNENLPGTLIFGKNNSGKTVYLRSVGTAQLLAQAGLPIPAESASVGIRSSVCTAFAAAENPQQTGAGRFEQEVAQLAPLIENSSADTLLLFNEIFQTTAYDEGAEGLFYILKHLTARHCTWVCVSHLTALEKRLTGEVNIMRTVEGYKLENVEKEIS